MLRECVVLVTVCVFGAVSLSGRGFFCRDPDTGKLHPVNSTWTAGSFCGKYHCKLKRKNITSSEYAPQRQINITNIKLLGENLTVVDVQKKKVFFKKGDIVKNIISTDNKTEPDIMVDNTLEERFKLEDNNNPSEKDRYLSDKEIKSITEILHTVKKGDLDAIFEIYYLAQNINKELYKTNKDYVLQEAMSTAKSLDKQITKSDVFKNIKKHDHASYWYEPLSSGKIRVAELLRPDVIRTDINPEIPEMAIAMEMPAATIVNISSKPTTSPLLAPVQIRKVSDTFFNSPLSRKDFGKLPYYYPMSYFQRMSSYKHEQKKTLTAKTGTQEPAPASASAPIPAPAPVSNLAITNKPPHTGGTYQLKPSIFQFNPFTKIQHYNWSYPKDIYHRKLNEKLEARTEDYTNNGNTIRVDMQDNAVLINPDLENFQDLQIRASMTNKNTVKTDAKYTEQERQRISKRRKPVWQTDSLPPQILDEVRAHIQEKQRLFIHPLSLRKKLKLERVAKLLKLDQLTRSKRSTEEDKSAADEPLKPELYEVYIDKTTCNADYTEPGYFRYGNLSQPFPECCPQRIPVR